VFIGKRHKETREELRMKLQPNQAQVISPNVVGLSHLLSASPPRRLILQAKFQPMLAKQVPAMLPRVLSMQMVHFPSLPYGTF
jgi:hypothetical protein